MVLSLTRLHSLALWLALAACLATATSGLAKTELLVFSSPYCGPCQQLKPTVAEFARAGYPVRPVDVTQHPALASQFSVSRVPCLVMVTDGREVARQLGGDRNVLQQMFAAAGVRPATASPTAPPQPQPGGITQQPPALPPQPPAETAHTVPATDQFARQLLDTAVRITIEDSTGKSYGTGTIIDTREGDALVVTCGHLFRGDSASGAITIERFEVTPAGLRVVDATRGKLESYDLDRDVGLVSFRPNGPVKAAPVAPRFAERVNDKVWSVGCDLGADPTVRDSRVTDVDRYAGPPNVETSGAPVQGRSGGGLFNSRGELVGICFAADNEGNEGLYSGLASVHAELDKLGLASIYRQDTPIAMRQPDAVPRRLMPLPDVSSSEPEVRGQGADLPDRSPAFPARQVSATPVSDPMEQAGLEEIAQRASESEVVVIVRPREPGGQSEVIRLDRVSPAFVDALRKMNP